MIWLFVLVGVIAAILAAPYAMELRRRPPDPRDAPGQFAELSRGRTHYRWLGGARGPVAVCVHGLSTPSDVWEPLGAELCDLGYRVLIYDLYGRGFSDAVPGRQDADFLVEQLRELLDHEGLKEDLTLMGYSMGGSIVTAFAARHSHMVQKVVLFAPAGIEYTEPSRYQRMLRLSVLGAWLHALIEPFRLRRALAREAREGEVPLGAVRAAQIDRAGYFPAMMSSRRGILSDRQEDEHRAISRLDIPVYAFWGKADDVIPIKGLGTLAQWNRLALQETVAGAGHGLLLTRAKELGVLYRSLIRGE